MNSTKRPLPVTIIAWIYIVVGVGGFFVHGSEFRTGFQYDIVWAELTEILAIVCGAFMLRRQNWARWLAVAWIAFHVILSVFQSLGQFAIHCVFLIVIAWFLFRANAAAYFRHTQIEPS